MSQSIQTFVEEFKAVVLEKDELESRDFSILIPPLVGRERERERERKRERERDIEARRQVSIYGGISV